MYSVVMTDLGQVSVPAESNVLLSETALQEFTEGLAYHSFVWTNIDPGPANADYDTLKATIGALGTTPSVISTMYTCQIPRRKSAGSLILSILVADLVFLQASWQLYIFVARLFLRDEHKPAYCEGCFKQINADPGISLEQLQAPLLKKTSRAS